MYFFGPDAAGWLTNIPMYAKVRYSELYAGIDLLYYGRGQKLEYDFLIAGADPDVIRMELDGSFRAAINNDGDLMLKSRATGEGVRLERPMAYQDVMGKRQQVAAEFTLSKANEVGFKLGS